MPHGMSQITPITPTLHILHVHTVFRKRTATHRTALDSHPDPLTEPLVHPPNNRRLKRRWTFDEIH